jgi:hypothetical protein
LVMIKELVRYRGYTYMADLEKANHEGALFASPGKVLVAGKKSVS